MPFFSIIYSVNSVYENKFANAINLDTLSVALVPKKI